jgi:ABC-type branched-subunit amino acid transport system substrate-binding protein
MRERSTGQRGIPIARGFGFVDTGELRHELGIGGLTIEWNNGMNAEPGGLFLEGAAQAEDEVGQFHLVAGRDLEVVGQPVVDEDVIVIEPGRNERRAVAVTIE